MDSFCTPPLPSRLPALPVMVVIVFLLSCFIFLVPATSDVPQPLPLFFFFSNRSVLLLTFSNLLFFCFVCSLSGVHSVFTVAGQSGKDAIAHHLRRHPPGLLCHRSVSRLRSPSSPQKTDPEKNKEKKNKLMPSTFPATPETLPRVVTRRLQTIPHRFLESDQ